MVLAMMTGLFYVAWFAVIVGNVVLGLFIGLQAYRGFRRHQSGPMRYLSIGLILLTAIASSLAFTTWIGIEYELVPPGLTSPLRMLYRVIQFVGLSFIAYSLYRRP